MFLSGISPKIWVLQKYVVVFCLWCLLAAGWSLLFNALFALLDARLVGRTLGLCVVCCYLLSYLGALFRFVLFCSVCLIALVS